MKIFTNKHNDYNIPFRRGENRRMDPTNGLKSEFKEIKLVKISVDYSQCSLEHRNETLGSNKRVNYDQL